MSGTPRMLKFGPGAPTELGALRVLGPQGREQTFNDSAERQCWNSLHRNRGQAVQALEAALRLIKGMEAPTQASTCSLFRKVLTILFYS